MDAEGLAFDELYGHLGGYAITYTKRGYLNAEEYQLIYLVEALASSTNDGRWLVKYKGEISYVSPALFALLKNNTHALVLGQTMKDGTLMTKDKAFDFAKTNSFGACSKAHQLTQQAMQAPRASGQAATATQSILSTETTQTKRKRGRKPNMADACAVGVQGEEHKQVRARKAAPKPPAKRRKTEGKVDPRSGLDVANRRLMKQLTAISQSPQLGPTDEQREMDALDDSTLQNNFNGVEVQFM